MATKRISSDMPTGLAIRLVAQRHDEMWQWANRARTTLELINRIDPTHKHADTFAELLADYPKEGEE